MTAVASQSGINGTASAVAPADLAELMAAFNDVTARLQGTHESLHREVVRLKAELHEANEQLQRSRRLAELGEMAAGIAHEVRNPLGSIRLYAQMLEQDLTDRPAQCSVASKIASAVRGLDAVVGDVLSFARDMKVSCEATTASAVLEGALNASWGGQERVRVVRRGGAEESATLACWCDPHLMHQALVNIIRNALEAMAEVPAPGGGHILTLDAADAVGHDGRPATVLTVSDTGPGVSAEIIDRMFNPFFTTRKTGTGLGLSIVHRIVDAHGGRVVVWSNAERAPGSRGTTFELVIPLRGTEPGVTNVEVVQTRGWRHRRVQESIR